MTDNDDAQWVTVDEAARRLGRSVRTIQRMMTEGRLDTSRQDKRVVVNVAGYVERIHGEIADDDTTHDADLTGRVVELTSRVASMQATIDDLRQERDYLRQALSRQQDITAMSLTTPRQLEAPHVTRAWWRFWRQREE